MRQPLVTLLASSSLALLAACGTATPPDGIGGTLTAPPGGDVGGSAVLACYSQACDPSDGYSKAVTVSQSGASAPYTFTGLRPGAYTIIALKDANGSGSLDTGDYLGVYSADNQNATPVTPPAGNINIQMVVAQAQ